MSLSRVNIAAVILVYADRPLHYNQDISYMAEVIRNESKPSTPWLTMNARMIEKSGEGKLFHLLGDNSGLFELNVADGQDKKDFVTSRIGQDRYNEIYQKLKENNFLDANNKLQWEPHKNYIHNTANSASEAVSENIRMGKIQKLLLASHQIILTGAPGTGKTYMAENEIAKVVIENAGGNMTENYCKVQFHPNFDYSDFIVGLKPEVLNGQVTFVWQDGIFKKFADEALYECKKNPASPIPYVFVIDEINRADLSRVFGEVFSLLEAEYRYPNKTSGITLPNGKNFILPENLYIIGTMNDIDRSVESMDFALRRRFSWVEVKAADTAEKIIKSMNVDSDITNKLIDVMSQLNEYIGGNKELQIDGLAKTLNLGTEYQLGGAYFVNYVKYQNCADAFEKLWQNHIKIILNEYLRGNRQREMIIKGLQDIYNEAVK